MIIQKAITKIEKRREAFRRYLDTKEDEDLKAYAKARNHAKWEARHLSPSNI